MTYHKVPSGAKHPVYIFADRHALADALAENVAIALESRLQRSERAALALSGGETPALFLRALSLREIAWDRIDITLVDERWVDEASERSNARLVRQCLLRNKAAAARFLPLYTGDATPEQACLKIENAINALPLPFAAIVLGMGPDGHTASYFPYGHRLDAALDPATTKAVEPMRAPNVPEPRMTLTLPLLANADWIGLHIEDKEKLEVFEKAEGSGPVQALPIRAVLREALRPVEVFWCP